MKKKLKGKASSLAKKYSKGIIAAEQEDVEDADDDDDEDDDDTDDDEDEDDYDLDDIDIDEEVAAQIFAQVTNQMFEAEFHNLILSQVESGDQFNFKKLKKKLLNKAVNLGKSYISAEAESEQYLFAEAQTEAEFKLLKKLKAKAKQLVGGYVDKGKEKLADLKEDVEDEFDDFKGIAKDRLE